MTVAEYVLIAEPGGDVVGVVAADDAGIAYRGPDDYADVAELVDSDLGRVGAALPLVGVSTPMLLDGTPADTAAAVVAALYGL